MALAFALTASQHRSRSEPMATTDLSEARDRELVLRIVRGDQEAFRGLFRRYAPSAKALAQRVVRQSYLAEEIVQEAFLAVWKHPEGYDQQLRTVKSRTLLGMRRLRAALGGMER